MHLRQLEGTRSGAGAGGTVPMEPERHEVVLEFSRAVDASDPYSFQFKEQEYRLRVGNGETKTAVFPWNEQLLADLRELNQQKVDPEAARRLGEQLSRFLDDLDWGGHEHVADHEHVAHHELRVVIRSAAAELYALPWELVTLKGCGQHLAALPKCSVNYEWPLKREPPQASSPHRGRVLFAYSMEGGKVPADEHLRALQQASQEGDFGFDVQRDVLPRVSLAALKRRLEDTSQEPVSVLHVLCHGAPLGAKEPGLYGLSWNKSETSAGEALVDGGTLAAMLQPHAATLRMVVLCACQSGDGGALASYLGGVAQALHRVGIEAVVASRLPLSSKGSVLLAETLYQKLIVASSSLEEALAEARSRLRAEGEGYDWASLQLYARREKGVDLRPVALRPYRGLLAFEPIHRCFFFGREKLAQKLLERVQQAAAGTLPRFQVVAGASGTGKSSLVMAGLVPRLPREEWSWLVVRPSELARSGLHPQAKRSTALQELWHRLHRTWTGPSGRKVLLVLDQLEEAFTQMPEQECQELLAGVWALTREQELECVVVATMRVDYLGRCGEVVLDEQARLDAVIYDGAHRLFVPHMSSEELEEVIEKPAHLVGLSLEKGLLSTIRRDAEKAPGALPLLAHALDLLWQRRQGRWLTHAAYEQMGGVAGALTQTAEQLYDSLPHAERRQARRLLVRLVAVQDMARSRAKRRVWVEELMPREKAEQRTFEAVLEKLVRGRLLVRGNLEEGPEGGKDGWVQLAHEALLCRWKRMERWLEKDWEREQQLRELEEWAEDWEKRLESEDSGVSFLLVGDRLGYAKGLRDKFGGELSPRSQRLLDESLATEARRLEEERARSEKEKETMRALAEAQARAARVLRVAFSVAVVLLLGSLSAVIVFIHLLHEEKELREVTLKTVQMFLNQ